MTALDYLLKVNLYGLLFVGCYWLLLRRHTFFGLNRAYLLASAVLSLVLPLASLSTETAETLPVPVGVITLPTTTLAAVPAESSPSQPGPDWAQIGIWMYGLVAGFLLTRLLLRTRRLLSLIRRAPRQIRTDYVLVQPNDLTIPTFSFFRFLVLNPADVDSDRIIRHELGHIRQYHTADVWGLAALRSVFWACPALWLLDRALRHVHEFLADRAASGQDRMQPTSYARFLVEYTFGVRPDALTNGFFNPSLLNQRIRMLHRSATSRWALSKYALVLPLALALLAMTTARKDFAAVVDPANVETLDGMSTVPERVVGATGGKPLPGATLVNENSRTGTATDVNSHTTITINLARAAPLPSAPTGLTSVRVMPVQPRNRLRLAISDVNSGLHYAATDSVPQAPSIRIRGKGPLGPLGEQPLYVVDGVLWESKDGQSAHLNGLDPNNIQSIEVLKDASATSLYGDRGRNGVIRIITRKGQKSPESDSLKAPKN